MKKALIVLFVLAIGVPATLIAGGQKEGGAKAVEISWWMLPWNFTGDYPDVEAWYAAQIQKFEKENANVKVRLEKLPWEEWSAKITAGIAAGDPPDVYALGSWIARSYLQVLHPIDTYMTAEDKADFFDSDMSAGEFDGKHYAWPWFGQAATLMVNADLFEERGVALPSNKERDWTTDEFLAAAQKLTYDSDGDSKIDVYGFPVFGIEPGSHWQQMGWLGSFGANLFTPDGKRVALNSPQGVKGLQFLLDLQDKYKVAPAGAAGLSVFDAANMFLQSKLAMTYAQADITSQLEQALREGKVPKKFKLEIVQYAHPPEMKNPVTRTGPTGFMVFKHKNETPARVKAAMEFCRQLTGQTEQIARAKQNAATPTRKSAGSYYANYPALIAANRGKIFYNAAVDEAVYMKEFAAIFQTVFSQEKSVAQTLSDFERVVNGKMEEELRKAK